MNTETDRKLMKYYKDKISYEEANFTRLPETKKDKKFKRHIEKQAGQKNDIGNLEELDKVRELLKYERLI